MKNLVSLHAIVKRNMEDTIVQILRNHGIEAFESLLCRGTATRSVLNLLGLEDSDKVLVSALTGRENACRIMHDLSYQHGLNMPGNGIAFTMPTGSIAGERTLNLITRGQQTEGSEDTDMPAEFKYELLIAIINRGHSEDVMNAARTAGAMGGTILHAKGTNPGGDKHFFGVSIADEKEMVLILCAGLQKTTLMHAIMEKAGIDSPAHTILFSMPVDSVAGLKSVMQAAGEEI